MTVDYASIELAAKRGKPSGIWRSGQERQPWLRIVADVTGRTLEGVPNPQETSAVGAALIEAVGLGICPSVEATKPLVPAGHVVTPDASRATRATYDELYAAYRQVYRSLRGLYHTLNRPKGQAGE